MSYKIIESTKRHVLERKEEDTLEKIYPFTCAPPDSQYSCPKWATNILKGSNNMRNCIKIIKQFNSGLSFGKVNPYQYMQISYLIIDDLGIKPMHPNEYNFLKDASQATVLNFVEES